MISLRSLWCVFLLVWRRAERTPSALRGAYFGLKAKYQEMKAGGANPFMDPSGYQAYVAEREEAFRKEWDRQGVRIRYCIGAGQVRVIEPVEGFREERFEPEGLIGEV